MLLGALDAPRRGRRLGGPGPKRPSPADNARLARRLSKQRAYLLRFLDHDKRGASNNLAEREIRPAVIDRKLSAGNRTEAGAETHAVLASVPRICRRQGRDILGNLVELLRLDPGHRLALDGGGDSQTGAGAIEGLTQPGERSGACPSISTAI